jgi:alkanesulfonate monooxygenase SsuD/methylene tetrahydromethanopterin reductase-like flavin-dependent oxidoreductase (luciferase family)
VSLTDRDRATLAPGAAALLPSFTLIGGPDQVARRLDEIAGGSAVTEIVFQPAGDIELELEAFADAAGLTPPSGQS